MKYRTEWNLGLLYKGEHDPQIEKDILTIEKACANFEKKYKNRDFTGSPTKLLAALKDKESLSEIISGSNPWRYFALKSDLDGDDKKAGATATKIDQRISNATNKLKFFGLTIAKITSRRQKDFLKNKALSPYRYQLKRIFDRAKYNLTEQEEQLVGLLGQTSYTMWVDGQERVLFKQTIDHKGKRIPIAKAISMQSDQQEQERHELQEKINTVLERQSEFAEAEINAIYNFKKIMDERRGYKKPYSATVLAYENDDATIETLIKTVEKYFTLSKRFYRLHARLLGRTKVTNADRSAKIGTISEQFDFESAVSLVRNAFQHIDHEYATLLDTYSKNGQIDVYPRKGKKGGAYCWGAGVLPTFVLLNHTEDVRSVETLAHEMGHAIHTELSKQQPPRYRSYSTATAEVASTFFEQLVFGELQKRLPETEQLILLHNKLQGDMTTIFRQIAFFNFELELHKKIRSEGEVDRIKIAALMRKHLQSYLGPSVSVTEKDGYLFVYLSHMRRFFYVYSYAYGQLISRALFEKWKSNPSYALKIKKFLSAGRSMSPKDIFKSIGITVDKKFFEAGLKGIERDITALETLAKKLKKV